MRQSFYHIPLLGLIAATSTPVLAQQSEPSVESYLCTFAGKCGDQAAEPEAETRAAPETRGFRIARPGARQETTAAPETRGFRVARPGVRQTTPAPETKGFRVANPVAARPVAAPVGTRRSVAVARPASRPMAPRAVAAPAANSGRADLSIGFELGSDRMTSAGVAKARIFAQSLMLPELSSKRFAIEGHTDSSGDQAANVALSSRRAQAVADYLVGQGVDRGRLEVKGVGPASPLPGHRASDPANRRVEAALIS
ncbi:OmpA family protein [Sphingomonas sp. Y38-1Y]|jgi:outer membrane protein OmpA-like peptidoglycan-associated protein|uniref:OmpA family protein n=1 Tax=Sphingomonas sp. Y38-1Y TaxID=3078265 RepID=UPI0028E5A235|nr:OmpA family protein [Sphingomonas sp. Y38-1Y]